MLGIVADTQVFWITSRAAGTAALVLASLSVVFGLAIGSGLLRGRTASLRVTHEALSLATLAALLIHATALLGDRFFHPSIADLTIPFASGYRPPWMALGIVAGWLLLILGLSYYARARIGVQRWRSLHRLTALAWIFGIAHALGTGTDAGETWFLVMTGVVVLPGLVMLALRHSGRGARRTHPTTPRRTRTASPATPRGTPTVHPTTPRSQ